MEAVLSHLNSISPSINFAVEQEVDNKLPFLDDLLIRKEDRSLKVGAYRKQTHTESHHPIHMKRGVVRSLVRRAEEISSDDQQLRKEGGTP